MLDGVAEKCRLSAKAARDQANKQYDADSWVQWMDIATRWDRLADAYDQLNLPNRPALSTELQCLTQIRAWESDQ